MDDFFKIYVLRLTEGRSEKINHCFDPAFMDVSEPELSFNRPVFIQGEASLAQNTLILQLKIETEVGMPCAICNQSVQLPIRIHDFCHTEDVSEIKGGVFDYSEVVREAILLEVPITAECCGGCPEREALALYFAAKKKESEEEYRPFEDL